MENLGAIATGLLEIANDGKLIINGNVTSKINGYINNGLITGVGGAVMVDYGVINAGKTTVYVPEPATMFMLGIGAFLLRKKK